jgi:hypothetical protein
MRAMWQRRVDLLARWLLAAIVLALALAFIANDMGIINLGL